MKKAVYLFLFYFIITIKVQAQQSDYYVVEEFKSKIEQFKHHIDNAITSKRLEHSEKKLIFSKMNMIVIKISLIMPCILQLLKR